METLRSKNWSMRVEEVAGQPFEAHGRRIVGLGLVVKIKFLKIGLFGLRVFSARLIP
jgi:hypothetical protein